MTTSLPQLPDLDQLRHQAKDLLKAQKKGDPKTCQLLRHLHRFLHASDADILSADLKLNEVQFALALEYGFPSWNSLKQHIESVISNEVPLPEGWDKYVSVGKFTIASRPFYALAPAFFNEPWLLFMCYWSMKNLTSGPLYIEVNYGIRYLDGPGGTGMSIGYLLQPHESREICTLVPIASATRPVNLKIRYEELRLPKQQLLHGGGFSWLTTEKLVVSPPVPGGFKAVNKDKNCPQVAEPKLARSDDGDYLLEFSISNPGEKDARLAVQTSVGDPTLRIASFAETKTMVKGRKTAIVKVPYTFPFDQGNKPLLAYCVFETPDPDANDVAAVGLMKEKLDYISRSGNVLYAGSVDMLSAEEKGLVTLPEYNRVPVEERVKLTEQRQSEHFLFRYRPDSYAALHIEQAINDREEAYRKLKSLLQMDLPAIVTIDLYTDIEAKGLGSGITRSPTNTVTDTHIAEVYNESYRCDPNHELAHIFTYHFGGGSEGVLYELFAASCETKYDIPKMMEAARQRLNQGEPSSLESVLLTSETWEDTIVFIHYLIKLDLAKFKRFYVQMEQVQKHAELDKVVREVYGTDLPGLEQQWHTYLSQKGN